MMLEQHINEFEHLCGTTAAHGFPPNTFAGLKAWRRARFAASVRLLTDLDEDGLKYMLKNLPSWVKVCIHHGVLDTVAL
jgi:hypothetical protein